MFRTHCVSVSAFVAAAAVAVGGCGGDSAPADPGTGASIVPGPVVFEDPLSDNASGWLTFEDKVQFTDGQYQVQTPPQDEAPSGGLSGADALAPEKIPASIQTSVTVTTSRGDSLRGLTCRAFTPEGAQVPAEGYELMVDGRLAMIRRVIPDQQPRVLAKADSPIANDVAVRLTAQCVEDDKGDLLLVLQVDGKEAVRASDDSPLPATRDSGPVFSGDLRFYTRADSEGSALLVWKDYEVRSATYSKAGA